MSAAQLYRNARLATFAGELPWGWIGQGAFVVQDGVLAWVGEESALPREHAALPATDLHGAVVTPGLVDCHTHLVYAGDRAAEFEQRLQGATYEEIARAGGGIRSTVSATRAASDEALYAATAARARALLAEGVTTLEVKSGYGLSAEHEARCLAVARRLAVELPVTVRTTSLGAHALPPEYAGRADAYITAVCGWLADQQARGLVDAVDAFCETIGFTPAQVARVFDAARQLGLPVKLHAEQLSDQGGAALASAYSALSCDHLEHLPAAGIAAMRASGTVAVLLPAAYYTLRDTHLPPVAALREAGVPLAVATDHNPGTSPALSLLLMLNMACTLFRLTPEEAWRGITVNGARALGLHDRGRLATGQRADFIAWEIDHPRELAYRFGHTPAHRTWVAGRESRL